MGKGLLRISRLREENFCPGGVFVCFAVLWLRIDFKWLLC